MRPWLALAAALILVTAADAGPGVPGPDYFKGLYERVGRDGQSPAGMIDDLVRIEPEGQTLSLRTCAGAPLRLVFDPFSEIENRMVGGSPADPLICQFHNNGENYPILTCQSVQGAAFTLWPIVEGFRDNALACGP